jgi:hypothetical protein
MHQYGICAVRIDAHDHVPVRNASGHVRASTLFDKQCTRNKKKAAMLANAGHGGNRNRFQSRRTPDATLACPVFALDRVIARDMPCPVKRKRNTGLMEDKGKTKHIFETGKRNGVRACEGSDALVAVPSKAKRHRRVAHGMQHQELRIAAGDAISRRSRRYCQ